MVSFWLDWSRFQIGLWHTPPTADEESALTLWMKDELSAKALLTHCIPESTLICVHTKPTIKECWDLISIECSTKWAFTQTYVLNSWSPRTRPRECTRVPGQPTCQKRGIVNIWRTIEVKDYSSTIIKSLPPHLSSVVRGWPISEVPKIPEWLWGSETYSSQPCYLKLQSC